MARKRRRSKTLVQKGAGGLLKLIEWCSHPKRSRVLKALSALLVLGGVVFAAYFYLIGCLPVSQEVEAHSAVIRQYAEEYQVEEYTDLLKAMMMQESGGRGTDPMQAAESQYNERYPQKPGGIGDAEYSIQCGVQVLRDMLRLAEVRSPLDLDRVALAIQGYNYGPNYILWARERQEGYTRENAEAYSEKMKQELGWDTYGDPRYVHHVLRYYRHAGGWLLHN